MVFCNICIQDLFRREIKFILYTSVWFPLTEGCDKLDFDSSYSSFADSGGITTLYAVLPDPYVVGCHQKLKHDIRC